MDRYIVALLYLLVVTLLLAFVVSMARAVADSRWRSRSRVVQGAFEMFSVAVPFLLVAHSVGFLGGVSNEPIIAAIIPAIISLMGGLFALVVGAGQPNRAVIGFGVCIFSATVVYSIGVGARVREDSRVERVQLLSAQEQRIRTWRINRGLDPDPPEWILKSESK